MSREVFIQPYTSKKRRFYRIMDARTRAVMRRGLVSWEAAREWVRQQNAKLPRASKGVQRNPSRVSNQTAINRILKWSKGWMRDKRGLELHQALSVLDAEKKRGNKNAAKLLAQFEKSGGWSAVRDSMGIKSNPSARARGLADEAAHRFEAFTGHTADKEFRARVRPIRVGLAVGKLSGVMYEATRDGETSQYFHRFKRSSRPLLVADHDGSQLGIVGGRYRFTDRGIVDE